MGKKHRQNDWAGEEGRSRNMVNPEGAGEDLREYIHTAGPGVLVVIAALLILLTAVIVWGFVGTLPVTETVTGIVVDMSRYAEMNPDENLPSADAGNIQVLCFLDASRFNGQDIKEFGDNVVLKMADQTTGKGTIVSCSEAPLSMEEAKKLLFNNDWVLEKCVSDNYNWLLAILPEEDMSQYAFTLAEVTILTEEVPPIHFLMR